MDELLVSPPVEDAVIVWLQDRLDLLGDGAHVGDKNVEGRCVRVIKTGSLPTLSRVLTHPQITLDSYDETEAKTSRLAAICSALMFDLTGKTVRVTVDGEDLDVIFAEVEHFGDAVNQPDLLDQRPRYSETFVPRARVIPVTITL